MFAGAFCGGVATAARVAIRDADPVAGLARRHETVRAELVVRDDPRATVVVGRPPLYLIPATLTRLRTGDGRLIRFSGQVLVLATDSTWATLLPGQQVTAGGRLAPARGGDLRSAVFDAAGAPEHTGPVPWPQRAAGALRAGLRRACEPLPPEPGGLLPGLVVGDTSRLEQSVSDDFRTTGMTHLLAVSGSNVAIVIGAVLLLVRWCRAGPRTAAVCCAVALVGFVILVRPSPSVLRAAAMGGLGLAGLAAGRPAAAAPALATGVALLVLVDPALAADAGFALSVCATASLLLFAPRWRDALRARRVPPGVAEALAVPAAAQVACGPVIAGLSGTVGLAAVPANLLSVPAVAPATVLGVGAALLSPVWPGGAAFLAWLASWPARWLVLVAHHGANVPAGVLRWPAGVTGGLLLASVTVAALIAARRPPLRRILAVLVLAIVVGAWPVRLVASGWPPPGWLVIACDVGQGDAVVLPAGEGTVVLVDTGPLPTPVDHCLRQLGAARIALLVVTHFHVDHVGGVSGVFAGREVGSVLVPPVQEPRAGWEAIRSAAAGRRTPIQATHAGLVYQVGQVRLELLAPDRVLTGTRSDPNNNSLVIRATVAGRTVLLTGDAEDEEQRELLASPASSGVRADILKVAHHGSAFQDVDFLDRVAPVVALVSVGIDNGYGHPNGAVLDRLRRAGARVLRTDTDGDIAAVAQPHGLAVAVHGRAPGHPP